MGDSLRKGQNEWGKVVLPQLMCAYREIPHSATNETANFVMFGSELHPPPMNFSLPGAFVIATEETLETAQGELRQMQLEIRQEDKKEPF